MATPFRASLIAADQELLPGEVCCWSKAEIYRTTLRPVAEDEVWRPLFHYPEVPMSRLSALNGMPFLMRCSQGAGVHTHPTSETAERENAFLPDRDGAIFAPVIMLLCLLTEFTS